MHISKTLTKLRNELDGKIKPSQSSLTDIVALEKDKQLSHVGFIGHIAFGCNKNNKNFHRVDYLSYLKGDSDYFI